MIPVCIKERDVNALRAVVLAEQVRAAVRDVQAVLYYDEQPPALVDILLAVLPDGAADEHKAIVQALPELSDEQVLWLMDSVPASYLRFRVVSELERRPHLK